MPDHSGLGHPPIDPPVLSRRRSNSVQNPSVRPRVQRTHSNPSEPKLIPPLPIQLTASDSSLPPPPPRPNRNPARTSVSTQHAIPPLPQKVIQVEPTFPRVPRTGPQEEITPWELEPFPADDAVGLSFSPPSPALVSATTSSGPSTSLSSFVRRRKSTGGKIFRPKSTPLVRTPPTNTHATPISQPTRLPKQGISKPIRPVPISHASSSSTITVKATQKSQFGAVSPSNPDAPSSGLRSATGQARVSDDHSHDSKRTFQQATPDLATNPSFSTADRTILAELKRSLQARESQFFQKAGQKHHVYPKKEVPYPRSYERTTVDWDVWETLFCQQLCGSLTWHVFETQPGRVLDLGCGAGTWILECARAWKDCTFVGVDIVPLHPDLTRVGSDLAHRVTWHQANFLERLPFSDGEFDYVHVKRVARGVPEDKWDFLLEEITRVMKPGAAFEMIEEDLFFPGQSGSDNDEDDDKEEQRAAASDDTKTRAPVNREDIYGERVLSTSGRTPDSDTPSIMSPSQLLSIATRPSLLTVDRSSKEGVSQTSPTTTSAKTLDSMASYQPGMVPSPYTQHDATAKATTPRKGRVSRPSSSSSRLGVTNSSVSALASTHSSPMMGGKEPIPLFSSPSLPHSLQPSQGSTQASSRYPASTLFEGNAVPQGDAFLMRAMSKPPTNPRDHGLLNKIYREMHSSRFINLNPLSILANSLGLYLKDVRTHPPLQYFFPPTASSMDESFPSDQSSAALTDGSDAEDTPGPSLHRPRSNTIDVLPAASRATRRRRSTTTSCRNGSPNMEDEQHFLSMKDLLQQKSQYVRLDGSRMTGFAPSTRPGQQSRYPSSGKASSSTPVQVVDGFPTSMDSIANHTKHVVTRSRLPNETLRMDVRTLNLHLAMRVAEILACSEAMWEWVVDFQRQRKQKRAADDRKVARRSRAGSLAGHGDSRASAPKDPVERRLLAIEQLNRYDFDELLFNFKLDMREQAVLGGVLEDRFGWTSLPSNSSLEREIFEKACERWDEYLDTCEEQEQLEQETRRMHYTEPTLHKHKSSSSSNILESPIYPISSPALPDFSRPIRSQSSANTSTTDRSRSLHTRQRESPEKLKLSRAMRVFVAWKEG